MECILTYYPFPEISTIRNLNVHHQLRFSSSFADQLGEQANNFAILHDLKQLVQHPVRVADRIGDAYKILDLTFNPSVYSLLLCPSGSSNQHYFRVLSYRSIAPVPPWGSTERDGCSGIIRLLSGRK